MTPIKLTTQAVEPVFKEPRRSMKYDWAMVAAAAQEAAGEWIRLDDLMNRGYVYQINHGRIRVFQPAGTYEARCKLVNQNTDNVELYIRYLGEKTDAE